MTTTYYHKISDLMVRIVRSSVPSSLLIFSTDPLEKKFLSNITIAELKVDGNFNKDILNGYQKVHRVEAQGEFSNLGDTYIIFLKDTEYVLRVELFGDKIESLALLDYISLRKIRDLKSAYIPQANLEQEAIIGNNGFLFDYDIESEPDEIINFFYNKSLDFPDKFFSLPIYANKEKLWELDLTRYAHEYFKFRYFGQSVEGIKHKLKETFESIRNQGLLKEEYIKEFWENAEFTEDNSADKGFYSNELKVLVLTDQEAFGTLFYKSAIQNKNISKLFNGEIKEGDYIVHDLHGVGIYRGIISQDVAGELRDYIKIEYLDNDILYVPYSTADNVSKFIGEGGEPKLTRLGSTEWDTVRAKAKKDIEEMADELLDLYARREMEKGFAYDIEDPKEMFEQLVTDFGYNDTPDQRRSTFEILEDMEDEKPMDRLLVGDVGFGKTEIAVRAAYIAVLNHKQVVVLAPTTILVSQLYKVFVERLAKYGVKIAKVSRFEGDKNNTDRINELNEGKLDIIIGTHRLLSEDVKPHDIGLFIIDEEQRFGVKQKEKIKSFKANIDVLSMSATPIPRTLQMSLSGIRDISVISTPPPGRQSVITKLISKGEIYEPIHDELKRGGQVFIVHNNIATIYTLEKKIQEKIPEARIVVGHAKMSGDKLEKIMTDFTDGNFDILIATTIIENGIDIPSVNTMIIDDAQMFGLSQLHQLRGRVGRSDTQAYCYLIVPYRINNGKIDEKEIKKIKKQLEKEKIAKKNKYDVVEPEEEKKEKKEKEITIDGIERIKAIMQYQSLGSGFHIASKDLEIRGGGSVLSSSQSGHINTIGYDMYLRMLYNEINKKKVAMK